MTENAHQATNLDGPGDPTTPYTGVGQIIPVDSLAEAQRLAARVNTARRTISIGRDVHYQANDVTTYVAKVTAVDPDTGRPTLAVFLPGEAHLLPVANVPEGTTSGTWRWPTLL